VKAQKKITEWGWGGMKIIADVSWKLLVVEEKKKENWYDG
jgi:hypothetical protein